MCPVLEFFSLWQNCQDTILCFPVNTLFLGWPCSQAFKGKRSQMTDCSLNPSLVALKTFWPFVHLCPKYEQDGEIRDSDMTTLLLVFSPSLCLFLSMENVYILWKKKKKLHCFIFYIHIYRLYERIFVNYMRWYQTPFLTYVYPSDPSSFIEKNILLPIPLVSFLL